MFNSFQANTKPVSWCAKVIACDGSVTNSSVTYDGDIQQASVPNLTVDVDNIDTVRVWETDSCNLYELLVTHILGGAVMYSE